MGIFSEDRSASNDCNHSNHCNRTKRNQSRNLIYRGGRGFGGGGKVENRPSRTRFKRGGKRRRARLVPSPPCRYYASHFQSLFFSPFSPFPFDLKPNPPDLLPFFLFFLWKKIGQGGQQIKYHAEIEHLSFPSGLFFCLCLFPPLPDMLHPFFV